MIKAKEINYYNNDGESFADVKINDLVFNCRVAGLENSGDAIILLHGFPETSRMWHDLIKVLDENNYRVIAPDQRGYSQMARPNTIEDYRIDKLSDDIINIANQFDINKLDVSGISTFKGAIDVNADLDVDGHTNLDNVSIAGVDTETSREWPHAN